MSSDTACGKVTGFSGKDRRGALGSLRGSGGNLSHLLAYTHNVGSTCDLGLQDITLTPGASSTCTGSACSCSSCCCW
jgi:hypothetical protein